jgi:hypothetical protein
MSEQIQEIVDAILAHTMQYFQDTIFVHENILFAKIFPQYHRYQSDLANIYLFVETASGEKRIFQAPKPFLYNHYLNYLFAFFTKRKIKPHAIKLRVSTGFYTDYPSWSTLEDTFFLMVIDIDDITEQDCQMIIELLNANGYTPTYVVKTTKGYHFLWLSRRYLIKEDNVLFSTFKMFLSTFFNQIKRLIEKELPHVHLDKLIPLEGFYTRADGIVIYEGMWYESFWDLYSKVISLDDKSSDEELNRILNNQIDFDNDYATTLYYALYDVKSVKKYTETFCPVMNQILNTWDTHSYVEWKIAIWFYYLLYQYFSKNEEERSKVLQELLDNASLYKKEPVEKARSKTQKFFNWFVKRNFPLIFWSCRRFNREFGCPPTCPKFNKVILPIMPTFILPDGFEVVDKMYFSRVSIKKNDESDGLELKYVCRFFYPLWFAINKIESENVSKAKIIVAGSNKIDEFILKLNYEKGFTEAEMLGVSDKKRYKNLLEFFYREIPTIIEPNMLGFKHYSEPLPIIRLRNFITASLEDHPFSNFYLETSGSYQVFKQVINQILYKLPDDYFIFKLGCWLALLSIFFLRRYDCFSMNPIFILIGSTGCGKTSILKLYNTFFRKMEHFFTLHAHDITSAFMNRRLPYFRTPFVGDDFIVNDDRDIKYMKQLVHDLANRRISKANIQFSRATEIIMPCLFTMETKYYVPFMIIEGMWRRLITFNIGYRNPQFVEKIEDFYREYLIQLTDNWGWGFELYQEIFLPYEDELYKLIQQGMYKHVDYAVYDYDPMLKTLFILDFMLHKLYDKEKADFYFKQLLHILVAPKFKEYTIYEPSIFDTEVDFIMFNDLLSTIKAQGDKHIDRVIALEHTTTYNGELHLFYNFLTKIYRQDWITQPNLNPFWLVIVKGNPMKFILQDPYHKDTINNFIHHFPKEFQKFLQYLRFAGYDFIDLIKQEFHHMLDKELNEIADKWQ